MVYRLQYMFGTLQIGTGLESLLPRPVHLPLPSESCWAFSPGLLFNSTSVPQFLP